MQNNIDSNTMNNIKNLVEKGDISQAISQISPEMLESFSKMMNNSQNTNNSSKTGSNNNTQNVNHSTYNKSNMNSNYSNSNFNNNSYSKNSSNDNFTNKTNTSNGNSSSNFNNFGNFDFSNIDVNTIMKMKSIMENMNNKNDASHNLLYSLKPYLRESKQEKIDQYANLLNISKIAEAFNNSNNQH